MASLFMNKKGMPIFFLFVNIGWIQLGKGEEMEWLIEDRNTYVLRRIKKSKSLTSKQKHRLS